MGAQGIDATMTKHKLDAIVAPTQGPASLIDLVNGDPGGGGSFTAPAAVAGYPHVTVPMGFVRGLPVGLSFVGPRVERGDAAQARVRVRAGGAGAPEADVRGDGPTSATHGAARNDRRIDVPLHFYRTTRSVL